MRMEQQESLIRNQKMEKLWKPRKEMERCTRFADAEQAENWKLVWQSVSHRQAGQGGLWGSSETLQDGAEERKGKN